MAYYLGIKKGIEWKPLKLVDDRGNDVPNEIMDIIRFTLSFENRDAFLKYLIDHQIIEESESEFGYIKGSLKNREYERITNGHTLYFKDSTSYFSLEEVKEKIERQKYNTAFIDALYAYYLKKHDFLNKLMYSIEYRRTYENFESFITILLSKPFTEEMKKILLKLRKQFKAGESCTHFLEQLHDQLSSSPADLILLFQYNYPDKAKIPSLRYLKEIHLLIHQIEEEGLCYLDTVSSEEKSYIKYSKDFLALLLYQYDRKTKEFKVENGTYKVQERNLCDLGMFLYHYDMALYYEKCKSSMSEEVGDDFDPADYSDDRPSLLVK